MKGRFEKALPSTISAAIVFIYTQYEDKGHRVSDPWLHTLGKGKDGKEHERTESWTFHFLSHMFTQLSHTQFGISDLSCFIPVLAHAPWSTSRTFPKCLQPKLYTLTMYCKSPVITIYSFKSCRQMSLWAMPGPTYDLNLSQTRQGGYRSRVNYAPGSLFLA